MRQASFATVVAMDATVDDDDSVLSAEYTSNFCMQVIYSRVTSFPPC